MIVAPVKLLISEVSQLTIKRNTWHIQDFLKAVGSNIRASSLFNGAIIASYSYFNRNIFSEINPLAFVTIYVSSVQTSTLRT